MTSGRVEKLEVAVFQHAEEMGRQAANDFARHIGDILKMQDVVRCVFAAAPSQNQFLKHLVNDKKVDWSRIEAFHMDEYLGLEENSKASFSYFLKDKLFSKVPVRQFHEMDARNMKPSELCDQYTNLLEEKEIDVVVMGIGENGHIAFNDPPVADFDDPLFVKVVELDLPCRQQQVNDGAFKKLDEVPTHAVTMTIPALTKTKKIFCIVPGERKADAVYNTLVGPIQTKCPASILRTCSHAKLYLDNLAFGKCEPSLLEV